jgi:hypothetical protein
MRKPKRDLNDHLRHLQEEAREAEIVQRRVESREPAIDRLASEMRGIRAQNHFTELFISTVGGPRR